MNHPPIPPNSNWFVQWDDNSAGFSWHVAGYLQTPIDDTISKVARITIGSVAAYEWWKELMLLYDKRKGIADVNSDEFSMLQIDIFTAQDNQTAWLRWIEEE